MTVTVLKMQGKGDGRADYVSVHQFDSEDDTLVFLKANNTPNSKYWTVSFIATDGYTYETYTAAN